MTEGRKKKIIIRGCSVLLMIFAVVFGSTFPNNYCLGDRIFEGLGLNAWSEGAHGNHYPAILALVMFTAACGLFVSTTEDKMKARRHLIAWIALILVAAWVISLI